MTNDMEVLKAEMKKIDALARASDFKAMSQNIKDRLETKLPNTDVLCWLRTLSCYSSKIPNYFEYVEQYRKDLDARGMDSTKILRGLSKEEQEKMGEFSKMLVGTLNKMIGWPEA